MTTRAGVFAGGDAVTGPNMVVEAMAAGKLAAEMIEKYVTRTAPAARLSRSPGRRCTSSRWMLSEEEVQTPSGRRCPTSPSPRRPKNFQEVEIGLTEEMAVREARRCLRCDLETEDGKIRDEEQT